MARDKDRRVRPAPREDREVARPGLDPEPRVVAGRRDELLARLALARRQRDRVRRRRFRGERARRRRAGRGGRRKVPKS